MFGRTKQYTGIDIQGRDMCLATIQEKSGKRKVVYLDAFRFEKPLVNNGRLQHIPALSQAFATLSKKQIAKKVHYSMPTQHVVLRSIKSLPNLPLKDLNKIIQFELGESIHLPFQNPIYDMNKIGVVEVNVQEEASEEYLMMPELANKEGSKTEERSHVLLVASSRELAEDITKLAKQSSQNIVSIDLRATAIQRTIEALEPDCLEQTSVIIDIASQHVDVHIIDKGLIVFTRSLPVNKYDYFKRHIGAGQEANLGWPQEVAAAQNDIALAENLVKQNNSHVKVTDETIEISSAWDPEQYVNDLVNEIERAQNFYRFNMNQGSTSFQQFIITGHVDEVLMELLNRRLEQPIKQLDYNPLLAPRVPNIQLVQMCSTAIGLALRMSEQRIAHE